MKFQIKSRLTLQHLDTAFRLLKTTHWGKPITSKKFKRQNENTKTYGIFCGKEMTGFFRVLTDGAFVCYLMDLVVEPEFRGKGAASAALNFIEKKFKGYNILLKSSKAQKLYLVKGYKTILKPDNYFVKNCLKISL